MAISEGKKKFCRLYFGYCVKLWEPAFSFLYDFDRHDFVGENFVL